MKTFSERTGLLGDNPDKKIAELTNRLKVQGLTREEILDALHLHEVAHAAQDPDFERGEIEIHGDESGIGGNYYVGRGNLENYSDEEAIRILGAPGKRMSFSDALSGLRRLKKE